MQDRLRRLTRPAERAFGRVRAWMWRVAVRSFLADYRVFRDVPRAFAHSWAVIWRALIKYDETDGEQRAASFAYYAFFALFPLILFLITLGAMFLGDDKKATDLVMEYVNQYLPITPEQLEPVMATINGFMKNRGSAGFIALGALLWSATRFFQALVHGVNKAWGTKEYSWWRIPIQNLFMTGILASALLLGVIAPAAVSQVRNTFWQNARQLGLEYGWIDHAFTFSRWLIPFAVLWYGLTMFYIFAPRRRTRVREVWLAALIVTIGLEGLKNLFILYTLSIGDFNRIYGAFGSMVALLMWIYLSGSVIILGGCIAAAQFEIRMRISDQSEASTVR